MSFADRQRELRRRSEYALRLVAMEEVGRRYPERVSKSALPPAGVFWGRVFAPLYRRVPWSFKRNAMRKLNMTSSGWAEDARRFREPWRPPRGGR